MSADRKVVDRIEKLFRLASPASGTTEHERASAALELVRLMAEHNIAIGGEREEEQPRSRRREPRDSGPKATKMRGVWALLPSYWRTDCSACGNIIAPGDIVWIRVLDGNEVQYRHNMHPCNLI